MKDSVEEKLRAEADHCYQWSNGPGAVYAEHEHPYRKILYVAQGSITFTPAGRPAVVLTPGDALRNTAWCGRWRGRGGVLGGTGQGEIAGLGGKRRPRSTDVIEQPADWFRQGRCCGRERCTAEATGPGGVSGGRGAALRTYDRRSIGHNRGVPLEAPVLARCGTSRATLDADNDVISGGHGALTRQCQVRDSRRGWACGGKHRGETVGHKRAHPCQVAVAPSRFNGHHDGCQL